MGVCCVDGCEADDNDDVTYFPFPVKPALRRLWRAAVASSTKLHADSRVCSRHFRRADYHDYRGRLRLKGRVVPTLFPQRQQSSPPRSPPRPASEEDGGRALNTPIEFPVPEFSLQEEVREQDSNTESEERCTVECVPEAVLQEESDSHSEGELTNDIEDIIAPYHIEQRADRQHTNTQCSERRADSIPRSERGGDDVTTHTDTHAHTHNTRTAGGGGGEGAGGGVCARETASAERAREDDDVVEVGVEKRRPQFIEISVDADNKCTAAGGGARDDCLMLLENVQVDVDPSALMLPEHDPDETGGGRGARGRRKEDPISLLTSSDEDDVIIQEPHIDTVEVSSETSEDDVPLVKLVKQNMKQKNLTRLLWGNLVEYYCFQCSFTSMSKSELEKHKQEHSKIILVCEICNFTSASKTQFARHKKKHKEEKRFKCHLCEYKARHNMALVYHMKSHEGVTVDTITVNNDDDDEVAGDVKRDKKNSYRCGGCRFKCVSRKEMLRHARAGCGAGGEGAAGGRKLHRCAQCHYTTKRRSDLRRHRLRKHLECDDDDEYTPPKRAANDI